MLTTAEATPDPSVPLELSPALSNVMNEGTAYPSGGSIDTESDPAEQPASAVPTKDWVHTPAPRSTASGTLKQPSKPARNSGTVTESMHRVRSTLK